MLIYNYNIGCSFRYLTLFKIFYFFCFSLCLELYAWNQSQLARKDRNLSAILTSENRKLPKIRKTTVVI